MPMAQRMPGAKRQAVSKTQSLPAPTGGLDGVSALASMPESNAVVMDNWFPQPGWVELRNGYSQWSTGFSGWVETLMGYASPTNEKLFAISGTSVYDATAGGAIGAAVVTGLTNARWEYTNVATAGGQFLYAANATDSPLLYDGSSWVKVTGVSTPAITAVTTTTLRNPVVWKNRVWFIQDGTLSAWYLPTASVGGAASQFNFTAIFRLGGQLQAIFTASLNDGSTFDDYIAFMTTEGEVALYRGTDPAQAGLFNLVGLYRIGKPVGRRCTFKYGTDTLIICSDGVVSLTQLVSQGRVNTQDAISYRIQNLINADVQSYKGNFGWQGTLCPLQNKIIINVPQSENSTQYQYVMNTLNNAWCRFTNWNAATFCVLGDVVYFGGSNFVGLADSGQSDDGSNIVGTLKTAFSYLGVDRQKHLKMVRPTLQTTGTVQVVLGANMDFDNSPPATVPSVVTTSGSAWDVSPWDTSPWSNGFGIQSNWAGVSGIGYAASTYASVATNAVQVRLQALDYLFEPGGVL